MLVLSRKSGESIWIGNQIKVTLIESRGNRIRLGIDAPCEVEILRCELVDGPAGPHYETEACANSPEIHTVHDPSS